VIWFVDTNVFVYARDLSEPQKQPLAADWLKYLWQSGAGRLSIQVLQEYYNVVTRRLSPGLSPEQARADVRDLMHWDPVPIDAAVLERAWSLEQRFKLSWWDALIVGAAGHLGSQILLSEDLQDGMEIEGMRVLNPFNSPPPWHEVQDR
jgi:predicted nucleic acid-binding protein